MLFEVKPIHQEKPVDNNGDWCNDFSRTAIAAQSLETIQKWHVATFLWSKVMAKMTQEGFVPIWMVAQVNSGL